MKTSLNQTRRSICSVKSICIFNVVVVLYKENHLRDFVDFMDMLIAFSTIKKRVNTSVICYCIWVNTPFNNKQNSKNEAIVRTKPYK